MRSKNQAYSQVASRLLLQIQKYLSHGEGSPSLPTSEGGHEYELTEQIEQAIFAADGIKLMLTQLLAIEKIARESLSLAIEEDSLVPFLNQAASKFHKKPVHKDLQLHLAELPPAFTYFDETLLNQVLEHLWDHLNRYAPSNGELYLNTQEDEENECVTLTIGPTNYPLTEEEVAALSLETIAQSPERNYALYQLEFHVIYTLISQLASFHQGRLEIKHTHEPTGIYFFITLPSNKSTYEGIAYITLTEDVLPAPKLSLGDLNTDTGIDAFATRKKNSLLVVDDQEAIRDLLDDILSEEYIVHLAKDGQDGINQAISIYPDLIISDLMMPGMDGMELVQQVKQDERISHIPVILLTAYNSIENRVKGLETGADDYIEKSFEEDKQQELKVRIKNLIESRKKLQELFSKDIRIQPKDMGLAPSDRKFLEKALEIVEANIDNSQFNVDKFCKELAVSKTQLNRKLQALTDLSPNAFIRNVRLKKAARLLLQHEYNVAEIAILVGFNDPRYFSRSFKQQFQYTPTQYIDRNNR